MNYYEQLLITGWAEHTTQLYDWTNKLGVRKALKKNFLEEAMKFPNVSNLAFYPGSS